MCVHCEACRVGFALEHTGDVYSCDHFIEPHYLLLGNITDHRPADLVASEQQQQFGLDKLHAVPRYCLQCEVRFACHGGYPKDRFTATPDGDPGPNYLCPSFKQFFHHVEVPTRTMKLLLAQDQAPAELMRLSDSRDARRGRNEPCTCGSGRKWKYRHDHS
ncbi:MAG TPA: SPASM domain-containing protein [Solirubrobacteraceae bacterium]|nr:SPASM domain-containing protein [Solirubrobacteraceae bacterium]